MTQKSSVIHSQLLPMQSVSLLLPNTSIAEIVHYQAPQSIDGAPEWLLGSVEWRGLRVPLVSFESAAGEERRDDATRRRIAILNAAHGGDLNFFGIVTQGNPRLLNVTAQHLVEKTGAEHEKLRLREVVVNDIDALIPDMERLEHLLRQAGARNERVH